MSLKNIKLNSQAQRGFTIVELLIVVVVIAILAAITIVSYNGITNRANGSSAKSAAANVQKKIELYATEESRYPVTAAELTGSTSKSYYLPSSAFGNVDPTPGDNGTNPNRKGTGFVRVQACKSSTTDALSPTNVTGARITYYDYTATTPGLATIDLGQNCAAAAGNRADLG